MGQRLPPPPTLLHALVAIGVLIDGSAVALSIGLGFTRGHPRPWLAPALYTGMACLVATGVTVFLRKRQVRIAALWNWPDRNGRLRPLLPSLALGLATGLALGGLGLAWGLAPQRSGLGLRNTPLFGSGSIWLSAVATVLAAPLAEELLFRGLLFRALAGEWGLPRAILGSAALFAANHPLHAWPPVFLVGAQSAWLFHRTGRLGALLLLHMGYNGLPLGTAVLLREIHWLH